jgi:GGDEF domain-containing protein
MGRSAGTATSTATRRVWRSPNGPRRGVSDLFAEADRALYAAKQAGRGRTILALG